MPSWVLSNKGKGERPKLHERYSLGQVMQGSVEIFSVWHCDRS